MRTSTCAIVALVGAASLARAQTGVILVNANDRASSQPLEAVRVQVGTSPLGGSTDVRGRLIVRGVPLGAQTLHFTRIGFRPETQQVTVSANDTARVTVNLGASAVELTQVVVTGTGGAVEKRKVGASLASVDVAALTEQIPTQSFQTLLGGKVAGVRSSSVGGGVGSGQDLRIRGMASFSLDQRPAVYIDGVRADTKGTEWAPPYGSIACCFFSGGNSTDRLSDLNPDDIERVEILKGAAAATLYGSDATNGVIQIFTKKGRATDSRAQWSVGIGTGFNRLRENLPTTLFPKFTGPDGTRAKDANDLIKSGPYSALDMSVQGGTARSTYFVSGMLSKETGSIQPNDQKKGALRLNLTFLPSDKITVETRSAYTRNFVNELQSGNNWTTLLGNAMNGDPRTATAARPYGEAWVPVADIERMTTTSDANRWTGGITVNYQQFSNLTHRLTFGLDQVNEQKLRFFPYDGDFGPAGVTNGQKNLGYREFYSYTADYLATLRFKLPFGIESDLSAGGQAFADKTRTSMESGFGFPGPGVNTVSSAATTNAIENYAETVNAGFLAQDRFAWKDKLFTTVGIRIDGNSAFGKNYGFQQYPKIDASYDLTKDGFLPKAISSLRIRGAIGKAGKMPGPYDAFTSYSATPVFKATSGIVPQNPGNVNLKPETSTEHEVGIEGGLFSDRLGFEVSYYRQATSNAIVQRPNPPSGGFIDPRSLNIGEIQNHGWDASLTYLVVQGHDLDWSAGVRMDGNNNKVTSLGGLVLGGDNIRLGFPINGVWDRVAKSYAVVGGKAETTPSDTTLYFGPPLPTFNGSFTSTVRWKKFSLYGLVSMERGAWFGNTDRSYRIRQGGADEYLKTLDASGNPTFASDSMKQWHSILNATDKRDNVRLKELSLTWQLPTFLLKRAGMTGTTLVVSGLNLMWWDSCNCVDPNMNWNGADPFNVNNGFLATPSPRQYRLQLRTKF